MPEFDVPAVGASEVEPVGVGGHRRVVVGGGLQQVDLRLRRDRHAAALVGLDAPADLGLGGPVEPQQLLDRGADLAGTAEIPAGQLAFYGKRLQGSLVGSTNANADIARGYEDMHAGRNLRGVVVHEH